MAPLSIPCGLSFIRLLQLNVLTPNSRVKYHSSNRIVFATAPQSDTGTFLKFSRRRRAGWAPQPPERRRSPPRNNFQPKVRRGHIDVFVRDNSLRRTGRQVSPAGIKQLARHNAACFTHNTGYQQLSRRNRETMTGYWPQFPSNVTSRIKLSVHSLR
jgi:hypothetical protein